MLNVAGKLLLQNVTYYLCVKQVHVTAVKCIIDFRLMDRPNEWAKKVFTLWNKYDEYRVEAEINKGNYYDK